MSNEILKIGHRGAKGHVTENTLESIKKAMGLKVDGIEIDVHRCASGELVVFHDFTVDRITNGTGEVAKHPLRALKNLKTKGTYKIPTLAEVLILIDNRCLLNIDLKGQDTAKEAARIITFYVDKKGWDYDNILVSSFQEELLETVYKINDKIPLGVITDNNLVRAVAFAKSINAVSIHLDYTMLTEEIVAELKEDFKVFAFTVNNLNPLARVRSYGVDAIISDYPDRI
ncbi:glycerophosphodiester phosphodiesterase family protein [uncultured Algibacter sp.]|uniref:glycerophosphodiester phosphodiesterase n=1 Tax=uncultured Algibacter sp. TaxID=298659 RepID=UPI0026068728|nr:glycerophosphodiester phosphodiesterase family protein [uncultured Algibacter sp.]